MGSVFQSAEGEGESVLQHLFCSYLFLLYLHHIPRPISFHISSPILSHRLNPSLYFTTTTSHHLYLLSHLYPCHLPLLLFNHPLPFPLFLLWHFVDVDAHSTQGALPLDEIFAQFGLVLVILLLQCHISVIVSAGCSQLALPQLVQFTHLLSVLKWFPQLLLVVGVRTAHSAPTLSSVGTHLCPVMGTFVLFNDCLALGLCLGTQKNVVGKLSACL